MSDRTVKMLLLLVSAVVSALAAELALRALGFYGDRRAKVPTTYSVDDPVVDYRRAPNASWIWRGIRFDINQHGWRDFDYEFVKPPDATRIVIVGDSVTNGYGVVEMTDLYPKVLERSLNRGEFGTHSYQVIQIALEALNTEQEVHLVAAEGLRYDPDIVILGYVLNDPEDGSSKQAQSEQRKSEPWHWRLKRAARRSSLIFYGYRAAQKFKWAAMEKLGHEEVAGYAAGDYFFRLHEESDRWTRVELAFERLGALASDSGFRAYLVIFPVLYDFGDYRWLDLHRQVGSAAEAYGIEVLDLLPVFREYGVHELQVASGDHFHPNRLGHRVAGEALYEFLRSQNLR